MRSARDPKRGGGSGCFNCGGTGTCIFYPYVESIVNADAGAWLDSPMLDWFEDYCPYCTPPHLDTTTGMFFFWT